MLKGCTFWPEDIAQHYRDVGVWDSRTIWDMMSKTIKEQPQKVALIDGDIRQTYSQIDEITLDLAAALLQRGIKPTDRVVLHLPNIVEFVHYYLALVRIGAIPVMALRAHKETEIRHFIKGSEAVAYIAPDQVRGFDYTELASTMQAEFGFLKTVIIIGKAAQGQISHSDFLATGRQITDKAEQVAAVKVDPENVCTILLSGGTTSLPKLIPRTHQDYVLNAKLCGAATEFDSATVFMPILPLAHNYNLCSPGILATFYYGGTVVLCPSTETEDIFSLVEQEKVSVIAAVRPLVARWLNTPDLNKYDISSLKVVQNGGTRMPPEFRKRMINMLGVIPQEIYGNAEGLINMTPLDAPEDIILNSSGSPVSEYDEIKVVDGDDNEVPDGEPGELLTRGPYTIRGYYNAPDVNAGAFTADGFYRLGDIVRKFGRDIYVEGRKKDLINRGGEKINCEEVENLIIQNPAIQTVSLVAMPDDEYGEKACAFVVLKEGASLSFEELVQYMRDAKVASFKIPERLEVVTELPVSPVGKVLKRSLRQIIAERLEKEAKHQAA